MIRSLLKGSFLCLCLALCGLAQAAAPGYHVIKRLKLGGEGGWDYLTVDSSARRLYVSRGTHVMVIDIDNDKLIGDIPDTAGVHGIALAPDLNRGFISCGKADTSVIFDMKTLKTLGRVKTGKNPDAIVYDPASQKVFTFNGKSNDATEINAVSGEVISAIALGGKPEFAAADGKGKIYVNIEDTSEVAEIDTMKLLVTRRFSIKPGTGPSGLALDARHHRVFSGCANKIMTVLDAGGGRLVSAVPIGAGVDGCGFDPGTGLAFSANGEGTLTVAQESAGKFQAAETVPTEKGARTMAIDLKTHYIYLPTAQFGPAPAPTKENPKPRPVAIPGTFVILVVGK